MNRFLLFLLLALTTISSCKKGATTRQESSAESLLPNASGGEFEVLVISDKLFNKNDLKPALDSFFGTTVPAIPQAEDLFIPNFLDVAYFEGRFQKNANILILVAADTDKEGMNLLKTNFPSMIDSVGSMKVIRNHWSKPQCICVLYGKNVSDLTGLLLENFTILQKEFNRTEMMRLRNALYSGSISEQAVQILNRQHNIHLDIPKNYNLVQSIPDASKDKVLRKLNIRGLAWFKGETRKAYTHIIVWYRDMPAIPIPDTMLLGIKDTMTKYYVPGPNPGSYLRIARVYPPDFRKIVFNGVPATEVKGLWETYGDWMGGPFIFYAIPDLKNNRMIYVDAFIYAPETKKKPFVKRLELILSSFRIIAQ